MAALLALASGLVVHNNLLWRWDNLLYDAQLSFWTRPATSEVIIVAIDDESLNELGRWPWPRSTHARLIHKIDAESPKAIGLDIIFNEPDAHDPVSDIMLARAMRASKKVVLPVFMAKKSTNAYPIEALPLPEFTDNAAALGHVHVDIDADGIVRRVFLKEGIGKPHWMHYGLAVLNVSDQAIEPEYALTDEGDTETYSAMLWSKDYPFMIPYAGPPGQFQRIGYSQVLSGNYPKNLFHNRIVLIGTTAEGLGDSLPTPHSGTSSTMPGVEIIANVIDALINQIRINEVSLPWLVFITALLAAMPVLIYPYINPANTLFAMLSIVGLTVALVSWLLWAFGIWLPAAAILLFQVLSYPLWSWRRLVLAMRHINAELNQLTAAQSALSLHRERNIADEINFVSQFVPIRGWVLQDENGTIMMAEGSVPVCNLNHLEATRWSVDGYRYWAATSYHNKPARLGLSLGTEAIISNDELHILNSLISSPLTAEDIINRYAGDVLQTRIQQVQIAGRDYEELRQIIDDSLSAMADGVLICSSRGQIMLANPRASWYLYDDDAAEINGMPITQILNQIRIEDGNNWKSLLQCVLFRQERVIAQARLDSGRDLMVEISPMRIIGDTFDGFVVNFSDISKLIASERKRNEVLNFLSHDLRSPLTLVIAMIELAKNKLSIDEVRNMLDGMEKNTRKTLHLAEQFLQLSRANTSETIHFYDIDFNSVVLNAVDQLWALSNKMKVLITHDFDREELWTHAEPDLLERAILNLLSNAIKHSKANTTVRVTVHLEDEYICCCVADQGSGLAAEELPHLFEMFRRAQDSGSSRKHGIGLGLAFVDAVAKRHCGHIDVESRLGEGSRFCLKFPKVDAIEPIE